MTGKKEAKVKLQHYVPKVYLKNFSKQIKGKYYIYCFDKLNCESFLTNIKDIAFEKEFYDKVSEEQETEKILRDIESKIDPIIQKIILNKNVDDLTENEKDILSEFIAYQMVRTKEEREGLKDTTKQIFKKWGNEMAPNLKNQVIDSMKKDSIRNLHKDIIKDISEYEKRIRKFKWILIVNKSIFPFWTSDNPVIKYNKIDLSPYGNLGLDCRGFEMHIPLNSKLCLIVCDPKEFYHEPSKKIIKNYQNIIHERSHQVNQSTRFIFSTEDKFDFAKMMIKENPIIKDPNRNRTKVN